MYLAGISLIPLSYYSSRIYLQCFRSRELEGSLQELKSERSVLGKALEEAKVTILHLQDDLEDAHGTVAALTAQLAASFEARDVASLKSASALMGVGGKFARRGQGQGERSSLRARAAELAEEIAEDSFDDTLRWSYADPAAVTASYLQFAPHPEKYMD